MRDGRGDDQWLRRRVLINVANSTRLEYGSEFCESGFERREWTYAAWQGGHVSDSTRQYATVLTHVCISLLGRSPDKVCDPPLFFNAPSRVWEYQSFLLLIFPAVRPRLGIMHRKPTRNPHPCKQTPPNGWMV